MTIVFLLEAVSIFFVTQITGNPVLFVIIFPIVFLGYGQINTLLSATTGDLFGTRNVSANFGMIYTGKGAAAMFSGWEPPPSPAHSPVRSRRLTTSRLFATSSPPPWRSSPSNQSPGEPWPERKIPYHKSDVPSSIGATNAPKPSTRKDRS
jgi:hypothetical protein